MEKIAEILGGTKATAQTNYKNATRLLLESDKAQAIINDPKNGISMEELNKQVKGPQASKTFFEDLINRFFAARKLAFTSSQIRNPKALGALRLALSKEDQKSFEITLALIKAKLQAREEKDIAKALRVKESRVHSISERVRKNLERAIETGENHSSHNKKAPTKKSHAETKADQILDLVVRAVFEKGRRGTRELDLDGNREIYWRSLDSLIEHPESQRHRILKRIVGPGNLPAFLAYMQARGKGDPKSLSKALGIKPVSFRVYVHRAKNTLKKHLGEQ